MKKFTLLALFCLLFAAKHTTAQSPLTTGYYVIVAAYKNTREDYAKKYTDQLTAKGHDAHYGLNKSGNLFLVYVHYDTDRSESLAEMKGERQRGEFPDAWVRVVKGVAEEQQVAGKVTSETAVNRDQEPAKAQSIHNEAATARSEKAGEETIVPVPQPQQPVITEIPAEAKKEEPTEAKPLTAIAEKNTVVYLNLVYATKNIPVDGEVQIIDTERSRLIEKRKGNQYVVLPDPKSNSDQLTLTADVFGYRKMQHEIKYPLPLADTTQEFIEKGDSSLVITFELVRYQRGDVQTLYHVYFYNDAAIMLPESKYELNSLLQMMQENERYRIKLHGHSNGSHRGKILALGPNKNFFDMEGTVQGQGSAKDLSGQRASTIKEFLVANGVDASRVEVKAWGGKKPIYDKHSVNAKKNVRVEVEILSN